MPHSRKGNRTVGGYEDPEPVWELAYLFPRQGYWTEDDYLALDNDYEPRLMELYRGHLEVLEMPDLEHQGIVQFLLLQLDAFIRQAGLAGEAIHAPLPIRLGTRHFREPDVAYFKPDRIRNIRKPPNGADMVIEVVGRSAQARAHDLEAKPIIYAKAKIPEYWIVDPETRTITVLWLSGKTYKVHGVFKQGEEATSKLLKGFKAAVSDVFAAGDGN